ncbi:biglycan-like [Patiria miniata]|uniref:LRRNT domain-containing protein n=1 Tax=Patiria miniata TaxID=46514 RepID=A0A914B9Z3_PATMI|nr:biglycan-like [Patiria miniata]
MAQFVVSFKRQRRTCSGSLGIFWLGIALLCSLSVCLAATEDENACKICSCYKTQVNCIGKNLSSVPSGIPQGTTGLKLGQNRLTNIQKDDFKNLTKLRYLHLDDNQISYIQGASFLTLNNLQTL